MNICYRYRGCEPAEIQSSGTYLECMWLMVVSMWVCETGLMRVTPAMHVTWQACACGACSQMASRLDCFVLAWGWSNLWTSESVAWGWRTPHLHNALGGLQGCLWVSAQSHLEHSTTWIYFTGAIPPPLVLVSLLLELIFSSCSHVHCIKKIFAAFDSVFSSTYVWHTNDFVT